MKKEFRCPEGFRLRKAGNAWAQNGDGPRNAIRDRAGFSLSMAVVSAKSPF